MYGKAEIIRQNGAWLPLRRDDHGCPLLYYLSSKLLDDNHNHNNHNHRYYYWSATLDEEEDTIVMRDDNNDDRVIDTRGYDYQIRTGNRFYVQFKFANSTGTTTALLARLCRNLGRALSEVLHIQNVFGYNRPHGPVCPDFIRQLVVRHDDDADINSDIHNNNDDCHHMVVFGHCLLSAASVAALHAVLWSVELRDCQFVNNDAVPSSNCSTIIFVTRRLCLYRVSAADYVAALLLSSYNHNTTQQRPHRLDELSLIECRSVSQLWDLFAVGGKLVFHPTSDHLASWYTLLDAATSSTSWDLRGSWHSEAELHVLQAAAAVQLQALTLRVVGRANPTRRTPRTHALQQLVGGNNNNNLQHLSILFESESEDAFCDWNAVLGALADHQITNNHHPSLQSLTIQPYQDLFRDDEYILAPTAVSVWQSIIINTNNMQLRVPEHNLPRAVRPVYREHCFRWTVVCGQSHYSEGTRTALVGRLLFHASCCGGSSTHYDQNHHHHHRTALVVHHHLDVLLHALCGGR